MKSWVSCAPTALAWNWTRASRFVVTYADHCTTEDYSKSINKYHRSIYLFLDILYTHPKVWPLINNLYPEQLLKPLCSSSIWYSILNSSINALSNFHSMLYILVLLLLYFISIILLSSLITVIGTIRPSCQCAGQQVVYCVLRIH